MHVQHWLNKISKFAFYLAAFVPKFWWYQLTKWRVFLYVSTVQELLEAEAANAKSIEEEIEEERAKVDAKTPITEQVFDLWRMLLAGVLGG